MIPSIDRRIQIKASCGSVRMFDDNVADEAYCRMETIRAQQRRQGARSLQEGSHYVPPRIARQTRSWLSLLPLLPPPLRYDYSGVGASLIHVLGLGTRNSWLVPAKLNLRQCVALRMMTFC